MLRTVLRISLTLLVVAAAGILGRWMWTFYQVDPWTRDGRVRADIVQIAPDVSGLVKAVQVRDNQHVRVGDPLFTIDQARFALALQQAEAAVANRRASWQQAVRDRDRYARLPDGAAPGSSRSRRQQRPSKPRPPFAKRRPIATSPGSTSIAPLSAPRSRARSAISTFARETMFPLASRCLR